MKRFVRLTLAARVAALSAALLVPGASTAAGSCSVTPDPAWKPAIVFPDEPFRVEGRSAAQPDWVKFTILSCDPTTVYFQDSNRYPFHYHFATQHLDPLAGLSPAEFDQVTLSVPGQQAVLGAVLMPYTAGPTLAEYAIQIVGQDPYSPEFVANVFETVRGAVAADPGTRAFYFPTFEQTQATLDNLAFFEGRGIEVGSVSRWADGNACYTEGWALGRLNFVPAGLIDQAYLSGTLQPTDILLTDAVPAEIPFVAGVASLAPATPNSHVAILSATFGVPFVHLALPADVERAQALLGRRIVLRSELDPGGLAVGCRTRLIDVEGHLSEPEIDELLDLKAPGPLEFTAVEALGSFAGPVSPLLPADLRHFGGKAAHFGLLRQSIPEHTPVAAALSFDVWLAFLSQTLASGNTLREEIEARLAGHTYPPDFQALSADLAVIRDGFRDGQTTRFSGPLREAIFDALQDPAYGFDPDRRLRFRSSTNVEDAERFSGAGLYDSFSGCLADDLDGDTAGPSACDPARPQERGVLRAIRRVFASFYNDNAFLERLRYGVDESRVGMAVLVHHSFPDEFELANGVATLTRNAGNGVSTIRLVTQQGAVSVTNPPPGATPEEVEALVFVDGGSQVRLLRESNLVLLGQTVLDWQADYVQLATLLKGAADRFQEVTGEAGFVLDLEYKKLLPGGAALPAGGLVVKQLRPLPQGDTTPSVVPFLVNEPTGYCLDQSTAFELSLNHLEILANHRLKSRWSIETRSFRMTSEALADGLFASVAWAFTDECEVYSLDGAPPDWPAHSSSFHPDAPGGPFVVDRWTLGDLGNPRQYTWTTENVGPLLVAPRSAPVLTLQDLGMASPDGRLGSCLRLSVAYDAVEPEWTCYGPCEAGETQVDNGFVCPCPVRRPGSVRRDRVFDVDGVTVTTSYYWPPESDGFAFLAAFVEWVGPTVIEGLTSQPIVISGEFARSYDPERHGFGEDFLFEPRLDPDVPEFLLRELEASGIEQIHLSTNFFDGDSIRLYGPDGTCVIDELDRVAFEDCFAGTDQDPLPSPPRTRAGCLALWDADDDGDIDCIDWADFQSRWDAGAPLPELAACSPLAEPGRVPGGLRLDRGSAPERVGLAWEPSCSAGATDYAVYEGVVGAWYSHRPLRCSTLAQGPAAEVAASPGNRYFLVVPLNPASEGSYGRNGSGAERPVGETTCAPRQAAGGCPR